MTEILVVPVKQSGLSENAHKFAWVYVRGESLEVPAPHGCCLSSSSSLVPQSQDVLWDINSIPRFPTVAPLFFLVLKDEGIVTNSICERPQG